MKTTFTSQNKKLNSNQQVHRNNLIKESKQKNSNNPQLIKIDKVYGFTKVDDDYFRYLLDRYLDGKQVKIETKDDWMNKDPKDFRKKMCDMIVQVSKKNHEKIQSSNSIKQSNYLQKNNLNNIQSLITQYSRELNSQYFFRAQSILKNPLFIQYKQLKSQLKSLFDKLQQLPRIRHKITILQGKQKKFQFYQKYIALSDNYQGSVRFLSDQLHKIQLNNQAKQKLWELTLANNEYRNKLKRNSQSKLLNYFLKVVSNDFKMDHIKQLQNFVHEDQSNKQLLQTMAKLKVFCISKMKDLKCNALIENLNIQKQESFDQVNRFIDEMADGVLKLKYIEKFQKQITIQILKKFNKKICQKNQSFIKTISNNYTILKDRNQLNTTDQFKILTQKDMLLFYSMKNKLDQVERMIFGSKQQNMMNRFTNHGQKSTNIEIINQINKSVSDILDNLKSGRIFLQNHNLNSNICTNNSFSINTNNSQSQNQNIIYSQKTQEKLEIQKIVQDLSNDFIKNSTFLSQKNTKKENSSCYQTNSIYLKNFFNKLIQILNKISDVRLSSKTNLIVEKIYNQIGSNQKKSPILERKNQSSVESLQSQSLKNISQDLKKKQIYSQRLLQDNRRIRKQRENLQQLLKQLQQKNQILYQQFKTVEGYNFQYQQYAKGQQLEIQKLNQKFLQKSNQISRLNQLFQKQKQYLTEYDHLKIQLDRLKGQLANKQIQVQSLKKSFLILQQQKNILIQQKKSNLAVKQQEIKNLSTNVLEMQKTICNKDLSIHNLLAKLKLKQNLQLQFRKYAENKQTNVKELQSKIKQLQEQSQKSIPQKRGFNFMSFNSNKRQKSIQKVIIPTKEVDSKKFKGSQLNLNPIKVENEDKNQLKGYFQIKKNDYGSQNQQIIKYRLKMESNIFVQYYKPVLHVDIEKSEYIAKKNNAKIDQINLQMQSLKNNSQKLVKQLEEISKKNLDNEQKIRQLLRSNKKLREQKMQFLESDSQINIIKKQKETVQLKLKQITEELQKYKSNCLENKQIQFDPNELKELRQNLKQKCNQITQMQKTITDLSEQVSNLQKDKIALQKTVEDFQKKQKEIAQKNTSKSQIKSTVNQKNKEQSNYAQLQAQKKQMKIKILSLELDLDQKQKHYQELREKYKKQTTVLKNQIQSLTSVTPGFQSEISTLKSEIQKRQQVLRNKQKDVQNLNKKIIELQTATQKQNEDTKRIEEQLKDLKKENESMERQITRLCNERDKLESENNNLIDKSKNQKRSHKQEIQKMKKDQALQIKNLRLENARQVQEVRRQIKLAQYSQRVKPNTQKSGQSNILMKMEHEKLKKDLEFQQKSNTEKQQMIKDMNNQIASLNKTVQDKDNQIKRLQSQLRFINSSMKQLESKLAPMKGGIKQISTIIFDRFFQNQALYQQLYKKYLLYDLIQLQTKKNIKSTSLLYRLDKLNKVNFHEYVDGKNNVVAIIKTSNGNVFGGFSTSKLQKGYKQPTGTVSFIFTFDSPNTIEHFNLDEKKNLKLRSFDWDEYFFVFGNAEIRWRFGERKIYSNFAINNGYYETKGRDVSALLKQGNSRETAIVALDFYQVQFEK